MEFEDATLERVYQQAFAGSQDRTDRLFSCITLAICFVYTRRWLWPGQAEAALQALVLIASAINLAMFYSVWFQQSFFTLHRHHLLPVIHLVNAVVLLVVVQQHRAEIDGSNFKQYMVLCVTLGNSWTVLFFFGIGYRNLSKVFLRTMLVHLCLVLYFDSPIAAHNKLMTKFEAFLVADAEQLNAVLQRFVHPGMKVSYTMYFCVWGLFKQFLLGFLVPCRLLWRFEKSQRGELVKALRLQGRWDHANFSSQSIVTHTSVSVSFWVLLAVVLPAFLAGAEPFAWVDAAFVFMPIVVGLFYAQTLDDMLKVP